VLSDAHSRSLAGMSAGVYALMALNLAELLLNWRQSRYRFATLFLLVAIMAADVLHYQLAAGGAGAVSHSAHLGGYAAGLLMGVLLGRNLRVKFHERAMQGLALGLAAGLAALSVGWLLRWPPRTVWDPTPWCWARQVFNESLFGSPSWHCVRCGSQECIDRWSQQQRLARVDFRLCDGPVGWAVSEP